VEEHSTHSLNVEGLNTVTGNGRKKMEKSLKIAFENPQ
jgi:hypothetical protein